MQPKKYHSLVLSAILLFVIAAMAAFLLYNGFIWFNNPSKSKYPVRGIDVSHHQSKIEWNEVKKKGLTFVFIKATEGADHKDTRFQFNWNETLLEEHPGIGVKILKGIARLLSQNLRQTSSRLVDSLLAPEKN